MSGEAGATPEPVLFDFRAAPRIPPVVRAALDGWHSRIGAALRNVFTPRLREVADAQLGPIDLQQVPEYQARFGGPAVRILFDLGDAAGSIGVLQFGVELATHCVDRLLGGEAEPREPRPFTGIERSVLVDLVERMLPAIRAAAVDVVALTPTNARYVIPPEAPPIVELGGTVAVMVFELRCGAFTGPLELAIPLALVDASAGATESTAPADARAVVEGHVRRAHVTVTTRIQFRTAAFNIASMQAGTVLATGHPSHADVEIAANERRLFTGMLGRHLGHVGVRLLREAAEESATSRPTRRNPRP